MSRRRERRDAVIGVMLAAGHGTRLRPITLDRSKAMVPVIGRPLIVHVMETIRASGIQDFVAVVGPEDREIESFFAEHADPALRVRRVVQHERLGMAHALGCAAPLLSGDFVLSASDSLIDPGDVAALISRHREAGADVTVSVMDVEPGAVSRSAAVEIRDGRVRRIIEKPAPGEVPSTTISLPLYVCSPPVLDLLDEVGPSRRGEYDLADAFQSLIDRGGRVAHQVVHHRHQVSTPDDLLALNLRCLERNPERLQGQPECLGAASRLVPPVVIGSGVRIGAGCRIGPKVFLEGPCVIGDDAQLCDTVVLRNATIEQGSRLTNELVYAEPAESGKMGGEGL